jgi:23S rRNA (guanosine2251-2'-O)-methyltransferase
MTEREPFYRNEPLEPLPELARNQVHVVLENIRSAYNVGAVFRTADATALVQVHLCGYTAYPPSTKLTKTALGATDYVPWRHYPEPRDALAWLRERSIPIIGIETADDAEAHHMFAWPQPVAIVFGNELEGITPETLAACDAIVRIPMQGFKNSLNVATSFGVVVFEILRQFGALPTGSAENGLPK